MSGEITHSVMDRLVPTRVSSFFATHRFRPTLLLTVAMVALTALAIALGNWQRHRADEKSAANIQSDAKSLRQWIDQERKNRHQYERRPKTGNPVHR